jgi:hypothetical protein
MQRCHKSFDYDEGSLDNMWYEIRVYFNGKLLDTFTRPTMREARNAFIAAGYIPNGYFFDNF